MSRMRKLAIDVIPVYGKETTHPVFSGRRVERGWYLCKEGYCINADCNGAAMYGQRRLIHLRSKDESDTTISIRDSFVKSLRENFYHGLLIGILGYRDGWKATSNKESGDGFSDILIEVNETDSQMGIVLELKYSKSEKALDKDCQDALQQITDKNYEQELRKKGYQKILKYGIAFYHKKF